MYYMTSKHPVIAVEMSIRWRRVPFVSFSSCASKPKMEAQVFTMKSLELVTCIGHTDNRRHLSNVSKKFQSKGKTGHCRIRKVQFISQFYFFSMKSIEEGLSVFHDPNRKFRFPGMYVYGKRPAARNSKQQTLLSTLLAVWYKTFCNSLNYF